MMVSGCFKKDYNKDLLVTIKICRSFTGETCFLKVWLKPNKKWLFYRAIDEKFIIWPFQWSLLYYNARCEPNSTGNVSSLQVQLKTNKIKKKIKNKIFVVWTPKYMQTNERKSQHL